MKTNDKFPLHLFSFIGIYLNKLVRHDLNFIEQFTEEHANAEALPGETVTLITELPEPGLEVTWLKDNVPLSMTDGKYETVNNDCSYEITIPDVKVEDGGEYRVEGGGYESTVSLTVKGRCSARIDSQNESYSEKANNALKRCSICCSDYSSISELILEIYEIEIACFL